jgi:hypothetical protein
MTPTQLLLLPICMGGPALREAITMDMQSPPPVLNLNILCLFIKLSLLFMLS